MGLHLGEIWSKAFRVVNVEPNISCDLLIMAMAASVFACFCLLGRTFLKGLALRLHAFLLTPAPWSDMPPWTELCASTFLRLIVGVQYVFSTTRWATIGSISCAFWTTLVYIHCLFALSGIVWRGKHTSLGASMRHPCEFNVIGPTWLASTNSSRCVEWYSMQPRIGQQ